MFRRSVLGTAVVITLAACAGDDPGQVDDGGAAVASTVADVEPGTVPDDRGTQDRDLSGPGTVERPGTLHWEVSMSVAAAGESGSLAATMSWSGDPREPVDGGPFGRYGSCSGLRENFGAYSVFVSGSEVDGGSVDSVAVWSADRVAGPGVFDAEVRIERAGGEAVTASGTITVLEGLQSGEFVAFGPDGGRVSGSFRCEGADPARPLPAGDERDRELDSVEVFALLRRGDDERVVGLVADADRVASCPAVTGDAVIGGAVVRVDGDVTLGAISAFELTGDGSARLRVAGVDYRFSGVQIDLDDSRASGAFAGTNPDGTSVDAAFHCT